jgi:hypothetical protein
MIAAENGPFRPPALFLRFTATPAQLGPGVRIRLAPAASQQRTEGAVAASPVLSGDGYGAETRQAVGPDHRCGRGAHRRTGLSGELSGTIGYVANLLGEDEDWLHELSIDMFPEDGRLWVYGGGEDGVTAFTEGGIENWRQIIIDERTAGRAPPSIKHAK